jgi:hypothetical protein
MDQDDIHFTYVAISKKRLHKSIDNLRNARVEYENDPKFIDKYTKCREMYNIALRCHIRVQAYDYTSISEPCSNMH